MRVATLHLFQTSSASVEAKNRLHHVVGVHHRGLLDESGHVGLGRHNRRRRSRTTVRPSSLSRRRRGLRKYDQTFGAAGRPAPARRLSNDRLLLAVLGGGLHRPRTLLRHRIGL